MIFGDKFNDLNVLYQPEFDKIIQLASKNQAHKGDLLLWYLNGFYNPNTFLSNLNNQTNLIPYSIGPGKEGWSEETHYSFINHYRTTNISQYTHEEYLKFLDKAKQEQINIENLIEKETISVQQEMLVYLKIWESDMIIKRFYQLMRLVNGEPYDWYFKIAESSRNSISTGTRQVIIRKKIRDKMQPHSLMLHDLFKKTIKLK